MSVKRYDCTSGGAQFCQGCYTMTEDALGDWVKFEEYDALAAAARKVTCAKCGGNAAAFDRIGLTCPDCADLLKALEVPHD